MSVTFLVCTPTTNDREGGEHASPGLQSASARPWVTARSVPAPSEHPSSVWRRNRYKTADDLWTALAPWMAERRAARRRAETASGPALSTSRPGAMTISIISVQRRRARRRQLQPPVHRRSALDRGASSGSVPGLFQLLISACCTPRCVRQRLALKGASPAWCSGNESASWKRKCCSAGVRRDDVDSFFCRQTLHPRLEKNCSTRKPMHRRTRSSHMQR